MSDGPGRLIHRQIGALALGDLPVLDAIEGRGGCVYYFPRSVARDRAEAALEVTSGSSVIINGAPIIRRNTPFAGLRHNIPEPNFLAGCNVGVAVRNGESMETLSDWLGYHYTRFRMDGAVIVDQDPDFDLAKYQALIAALQHPVTVVVLSTSLPLGHAHLPAEAHPYCVSEAPGKDRMEVPEPDPWHAPLGESSIYEIIRLRFLLRARAAANIDPCDLLLEARDEANPFDMAAAVPGDYIELSGQHCFPWRVRSGVAPKFGDHTCIQFDQPKSRTRWCTAPSTLGPGNLVLFKRISNTVPRSVAPYIRCMNIRHPSEKIGEIVPKTSLIEDEALLNLSKSVFGHDPVRAPQMAVSKEVQQGTRTVIITTMKNEGPFILEWLAYHQAIGVQDFLVYTNDCSDGTDSMFDLLQSKGIVQHRQNPYREMDLKPQHAALSAAGSEPIVTSADWAICMDVDEFLNIKVGNGTLDALYDAVGDANLISCTWRLFGNSDRHLFEDTPTIAQYDRCAPEFSPKPHQAWGFKTLHRTLGIFKKMGVHRPKGLRPQLVDQIRWVNGSGEPLPQKEFRNAWRSTSSTYGYDLVALNHYAVRNAESFLVKRDRGRVNHVDRDQGLAYWFRMNNNATQEKSIQKRIPMMQERLSALMADPEIAEQHHACVAAHRAKIDELKARPDQSAFFAELISPRMAQLSKMHNHFGANVFLAGPQVIPDEIVHDSHPPDFFFTVKRAKETGH